MATQILTRKRRGDGSETFHANGKKLRSNSKIRDYCRSISTLSGIGKQLRNITRLRTYCMLKKFSATNRLTTLFSILNWSYSKTMTSQLELLTLKLNLVNLLKQALNLSATSTAISYSEKENKSPKCPGVILVDWGGFEPPTS